MSADRLTDAEIRPAEQDVSVLDFVSRCAQAIDTGDWHYLDDKASELEGAASRLTDIAGKTCREIRTGEPQPRTQAMRAAVAHLGRHCRAGWLLHPEQPHPRGGERR